MAKLPERWLDAEAITTGPEGDRKTMIKYMADDKSIRIVEPPFPPYFFAPASQMGYINSGLEKFHGYVEQGNYVSTTGERLVKISCQSIDDIGRYSTPGFREYLEDMRIKTFESDVPFVDRIALDCNIKQCAVKSKAYLDIEVEALHEFPDVEKAEHQIISISVVGNDEKEYFFCNDDEYKVLGDVQRLFKTKYHMVTGWNLKKFDWHYMRNRARKLKTNFTTFGVQEIDAMQNYRKIAILGYGGEGYSLEAVSKQHFGVDVESNKIPMTPQGMWESFKGDRKALREYNMQDSRLVLKLDNLLNLCAPYVQICERVPIFLRDTPMMTKVWEHMLMRGALAHSPRLVFPRRSKREANLIGGFTYEPTAGVYDNVLVMDYSALYPSIMRSFELSPELVGLYQAWKRSQLDINTWINITFKGDKNE